MFIKILKKVKAKSWLRFRSHILIFNNFLQRIHHLTKADINQVLKMSQFVALHEDFVNLLIKISSLPSRDSSIKQWRNLQNELYSILAMPVKTSLASSTKTLNTSKTESVPRKKQICIECQRGRYSSKTRNYKEITSNYKRKSRGTGILLLKI